MPKSICPLCGVQTHHNIGGDPTTWYARWPGVPLSDPVPLRCLECFVTLHPGSRVRIRERAISRAARAHPGAAGTINRTHCDPDTGLELHFIDLDDGLQLVLVRADIEREQAASGGG